MLRIAFRYITTWYMATANENKALLLFLLCCCISFLCWTPTLSRRKIYTRRLLLMPAKTSVALWGPMGLIMLIPQAADHSLFAPCFTGIAFNEVQRKSPQFLPAFYPKTWRAPRAFDATLKKEKKTRNGNQVRQRIPDGFDLWTSLDFVLSVLFFFASRPLSQLRVVTISCHMCLDPPLDLLITPTAK